MIVVAGPAMFRILAHIRKPSTAMKIRKRELEKLVIELLLPLYFESSIFISFLLYFGFFCKHFECFICELKELCLIEFELICKRLEYL